MDNDTFREEEALLFVKSENEIVYSLDEVPSSSYQSLEEVSMVEVEVKAELKDEKTSKPDAKSTQKKKTTMCEKCGKSYSNPHYLKLHRQQTECWGDGRIVPSDLTVTCDFCGKLFCNKALLETHIMHRHFGIKKYRCGICGKSYTTKVYLKTHLLAHKGVGKYKCEICGHVSKYSTSHSDHLKTHKGATVSTSMAGTPKFPCSHCPKEYATQFGLKRHEASHFGFRFECDICKKTFAQKKQVENHILPTHFSLRMNACKICNKSYTTKINLKYHMLEHSKQKPFACGICQKRFVSKSPYEKHMLTHNADPSLKCPICKRLYLNQESVARHLRTHEEDAEEYTCQICFKTLTTKHNKKLHMRKVHGESGAKAFTPTLPCSFEGCRVQLATRHALQSHLLGHKATSGGIPCMKCCRHYRTYSDFMDHVRASHFESPLPMHCWMCLKGCYDYFEYRVHLSEKHQIIEVEEDLFPPEHTA